MASTATTPKKAAEAALKARDEAVRAHDLAVKAHEEAKAHQADVEQRIATGSEVTKEEADDATFEVKVTAGRVWSTERARTEAEHAAQVAQAISVADELIDRKASRTSLDEAIEAARAEVERVVRSLVGKVRHRNKAIADAVESGKAAALQEGLVDPASPVVLKKKFHQHQPWRKATGYDLVINGEVETPVELTEIVTSTLTAAARSAGVEVQIGGGAK